MVPVYKLELAAKAVQSSSLPLEGIDHVHSSDSLPLGMFSVSDSVADHVLEEHLQNTSGFFVDQSGNKGINGRSSIGQKRIHELTQKSSSRHPFELNDGWQAW